HNHLLPSFNEPDRPKPGTLKHLSSNGPTCPAARLTKQLLVFEPPMQSRGLSLTEENLLQLKDLKFGPCGETRAQWKSNGPSNEVASAEHTQKGRERLVRATSLIMGRVSASFTNETMACRHSGQGIEPGGPWPTDDVAYVEQRYMAQCQTAHGSKQVDCESLHLHPHCLKSVTRRKKLMLVRYAHRAISTMLMRGRHR
ncbi:Arf-GAP with coiled-coil, partial [Striga asiatica]